MQRHALKIVVMLAIASGLGACNRETGGRALGNLRQSAVAPDEFLVVPQKPLETPGDLGVLPVPVPGASNRVDIDVEGELLAALGGRVMPMDTVPAAEVALVRAAQSSGGVTPNIRDLVRAEDQAFRETRDGRLERLARKRRAAEIYNVMLLNPVAEAARLRALGIQTPTLPPL